MGPFAGMVVTGLVFALGTGIVLTAMVARGTEMLAHAARGRQARTARVRTPRPRPASAARRGMASE